MEDQYENLRPKMRQVEADLWRFISQECSV